MAAQPSPEPASLHWQADGELAADELFALVCRLRDVETAEHSNELWRLGHKSPADFAAVKRLRSSRSRLEVSAD